MTFKEIDKIASTGEPIEGRQPIEVRYCYTLLKLIYDDYKSGNISREQTKQKRKEIKQSFDEANYYHALYDAHSVQYQEFMRLGEEYNYKIKDALWSHADPLELIRLCLKLYGALTGDNTVADAYIKKMEENYGNKK